MRVSIQAGSQGVLRKSDSARCASSAATALSGARRVVGQGAQRPCSQRTASAGRVSMRQGRSMPVIKAVAEVSSPAAAGTQDGKVEISNDANADYTVSRMCT